MDWTSLSIVPTQLSQKHHVLTQIPPEIRSISGGIRSLNFIRARSLQNEVSRKDTISHCHKIFSMGPSLEGFLWETLVNGKILSFLFSFNFECNSDFEKNGSKRTKTALMKMSIFHHKNTEAIYIHIVCHFLGQER